MTERSTGEELPSSSLQVVNALVKAGKDFDLLEVPGGEHTVGRSTGPIDYIERRQFAFFVKNLKGEPTPDWNTSDARAPKVSGASNAAVGSGG